MSNRFLTILSLLLLSACAAASAGAPAPAKLEYSGYYDWNVGGRGRLYVTFIPDGDDGWDVTFRFGHAERLQAWKGTAIGEPGNGTVEGLVRGGRYRFHGTFENGVFRGKHFEMTRRGMKESGSLRFE